MVGRLSGWLALPLWAITVIGGGCSGGAQTRADASAAQQAQGQAQGAPAAAPVAAAKERRVEGVARNAKLSAALVTDDGPIYCLERDSWPDELLGKRLAVTGVVETTSEAQATTGPGGEISQGTAGSVQVIRKMVSFAPTK